MDIETQVRTYFAAAADVVAGTGEAVPNTTSGNTVTPLIDGKRYFGAVRALLEGLGTGPQVAAQFFYTTGWFLHLVAGPGADIPTDLIPPGRRAPVSPVTRRADDDIAFKLVDGDPPGPYPVMAQLLLQKAAAGVDVRVMGWVNPALLLERPSELAPGDYWDVIVENLLSINYLRNKGIEGVRPLAKRVCALTIGHLLGAMHLKMVVAHDGQKPWAFIGGIDFAPNRVAGEMHPTNENWHDMAVGVDGPCIQVFYDLFRNLWNTQISRPPQPFLVSGRTIMSVESSTTPISEKTLPTTGTGPHRVQVALTLPQFHFSRVPSAFRQTPLPFLREPALGAFEVKVAWRKAISAATRYVYIEDQSFWSQDVMDWINSRLRAHPTVKVILLTGAPDPNDQPMLRLRVEAINTHLLGIGTPNALNAAQKARVGLFMRKGDIIVHSKVTLIDDLWLFVGSANCMRRSLYTDGEMSVAALDVDDALNLAKQVRVNLWGGHFGKMPDTDRNSLNNLDHALNVWNSAWGSGQPYPLPTAYLEATPLPLPALPPPSPYEYMSNDADSRQTI